MSRRVTRFFLTCLLAWAVLALVTPASAIVKHCSYTILVGGLNPPIPLLRIEDLQPVTTPDFADFKVKGRHWTNCGWQGLECALLPDDPQDHDPEFARETAAFGARRCLVDAVNQGGTPPSCSEKKFWANSISGDKTWSRVLDWKVQNLKQNAIDTVCKYARGQRVQSVIIMVVTGVGWSSDCNIRGGSGRFFAVWQGNEGYCASDRPLPSQGRPLPPEPYVPPPSPVPSTPPPPQRYTAAPDLKVNKSAPKKPCIPNKACKFNIKIANDGLGVFKGPLTVSDTIKPASERLVGFGPDPWECEGGNGKYTCRHPETEIRPGQSKVLSLAFMNAGNSRGTVENCASIDWEVPPLEGICTAAIEEALARERETMDANTASETDKAVKEYQCKSGLPETGKPDTQLLRLAFKSIGMGDTNRDNDTSCAISSFDIPLPDTVSVTPETTQCTGGRAWNISTRKCACPSDKPNWTGRECTTDHVYEVPEACTGGRFRSRSTGECLCPPARPAWDGKRCRPRGQANKPPPAPPVPSATGPTAPACSGGQYWDAHYKTCRCPSGLPVWDGKTCGRRIAKPTPAPKPPTPYCSGGRYWDPKRKSCRCPSGTPTWNGVICVPSFHQPQPGTVTGTQCTSGKVWDAKYKTCRCPSNKPVWNKKSNRCEPRRSLTGPPTATPPTAAAPTTTAPSTGKIVCRGGKMVGALCWCGIGKFPKKVRGNIYQCQ